SPPVGRKTHVLLAVSPRLLDDSLAFALRREDDLEAVHAGDPDSETVDAAVVSTPLPEDVHVRVVIELPDEGKPSRDGYIEVNGQDPLHLLFECVERHRLADHADGASLDAHAELGSIGDTCDHDDPGAVPRQPWDQGQAGADLVAQMQVEEDHIGFGLIRGCEY